MLFWGGKQFCRALAERRPAALAKLAGSAQFPSIRGTVSFYQTPRGVLVVAEVHDLPYEDGKCAPQVYGMHLHEGGSCTPMEDSFSDAGGHYNPAGCPHPQHAGDMPPLFGNRGYAWSAFLSGRFHVREALGRTVIVHRDRDDFTSQPSGRSGPRIACGVVQKV